jgi:hypothetical protein
VPDDHTEHEAHKDRVGRGVVDESSPCISVVECKGPHRRTATRTRQAGTRRGTG